MFVVVLHYTTCLWSRDSRTGGSQREGEAGSTTRNGHNNEGRTKFYARLTTGIYIPAKDTLRSQRRDVRRFRPSDPRR